jgi:hypothetical protein
MISTPKTDRGPMVDRQTKDTEDRWMKDGLVDYGWIEDTWRMDGGWIDDALMMDGFWMENRKQR